MTFTNTFVDHDKERKREMLGAYMKQTYGVTPSYDDFAKLPPVCISDCHRRDREDDFTRTQDWMECIDTRMWPELLFQRKHAVRVELVESLVLNNPDYGSLPMELYILVLKMAGCYCMCSMDPDAAIFIMEQPAKYRRNRLAVDPDSDSDSDSDSEFDTSSESESESESDTSTEPEPEPEPVSDSTNSESDSTDSFDCLADQERRRYRKRRRRQRERREQHLIRKRARNE